MENNTLSRTYERGKSYTGVDWRDTIGPLPIRPNDSLRFCDLRSCILNGFDLTMVEFIGCRLNGTSFQGANLQGAQFIGCFSSCLGMPTDFRNCIWSNVVIVDSHFNPLFDQNILRQWHWPTEIEDIASDTLSEDSNIRYRAASSSKTLGNPIVALILACLLADDQWDIRDVTLEALGSLRQSKFPYQDQTLMEWIFLRLGDQHPIVRQTARFLIEKLSPSSDVLLASANRMKFHSAEEQLAGLRAAIELCRVDDLSTLGKNYSRLVDLKTPQRLLSSEVPEVRSECLHLLGMLNNPALKPWLLKGLSDPVPTVRIAGLLGIKLLSNPPDAGAITPLLSDPDEDVRVETLFTLGQIGDFDPKAVEVALSDPSAEVRRLAKKLLEGSEISSGE